MQNQGHTSNKRTWWKSFHQSSTYRECFQENLLFAKCNFVVREPATEFSVTGGRCFATTHLAWGRARNEKSHLWDNRDIFYFSILSDFSKICPSSTYPIWAAEYAKAIKHSQNFENVLHRVRFKMMMLVEPSTRITCWQKWRSRRSSPSCIAALGLERAREWPLTCRWQEMLHPLPLCQ